MKVVGLIAEYNPFHNGHAYHIRKAKAVTGASYCIVVMSGNYVQRGTPAVISKYARTQMALEAGADLVLELPVTFSSASAELFARAAVSLLNHTGIVDYLCFGSECGEIEPLEQIAHIFLEEPPLFREELLKNLKEGNPYPKARNDALIEYLLKSDLTSSAVESIYKATSLLSSPNNILRNRIPESADFFQQHHSPVHHKPNGQSLSFHEFGHAILFCHSDSDFSGRKHRFKSYPQSGTGWMSSYSK